MAARSASRVFGQSSCRVATSSTSSPRGGPRSRRSSGGDLLLRSVGFEPAALRERAQDVLLLRMVPFVERNYNMVELGPRGTGKSHLFQQVSPYSHLVSGGKATVAKMFVDNSTGRRGLVAQYDVVCFDEVSGIDFDQKDGVNILKGYMESGEFSRGKESIRASGGVVMVGNFEVDVVHQQRVSHLFGPFPKQMRADTAFMDRIHAYVPGWDVPKLEQGALHRALRIGQRLPVRGVEPPPGAVPTARNSGPRVLRRRAERTRHERGQQDGQRPAQALVPRVRPSRSPTRTSSGPCG